ncbi:MAG: acyl carrier protein [Planctomycetota bacterium]|nr:acyl carrier protein [Planctomycetota bacterium]MCX8039313.1 acyl carrier protein [Planctomycetota bacterium]MDW8372078.1 acyl carrier protein [Planctomycetota bacterium]
MSASANSTPSSRPSIDEIRSKVKQIIADRLSKDVNTITDASDLVNDLGADSLDQAEITMDLEDAFAVRIEEEKAQQLKTIGDIVQAIDRVLQEEEAKKRQGGASPAGS